MLILLQLYHENIKLNLRISWYKIYRTLSDKLENLAGKFPVIGIIGPRQIGKTTLAKAFIKKIKCKNHLTFTTYCCFFLKQQF